MTDKIEKEMPDCAALKVDELLRTLIGQCFEADNDTTTLFATLETADGTPSELEFEIHITSINGTKTRSADDDGPAT
jgi:hypothetical protein